MGFTKFFIFNWLYQVFLGVSRLLIILPSFTEFYWVWFGSLPGFTGFYLVFFNLYCVLPSFLSFNSVTSSFLGCVQVSDHSTEFYRVLLGLVWVFT